MPKTRNAFALRDFDTERILQRNFFLHRLGVVHEDTDNNVIDIYNVAAISHLGTKRMTEHLAKLQKLKAAVAAYTKKLLKHEYKLEQFMNQCARDKEKYDRTYTLKNCYCEAIELLGNLQKEIAKLIREGEKSIPKIFCREMGERIIKARNNAGLSRLEVANELGLSQNALGQYERGEREISLWTLARLSELLSRSPNQLLGYSS